MMLAILASLLISTNATPRELVMSCREMIPSEVELTGRLVMRNRRGITQSEYDYIYTRKAGVPSLTINGEDYPLYTSSSSPIDNTSSPSPIDNTSLSSTIDNPQSTIKGTDVTVSDITLDYLWWDDFSFDEEREGETVNGQVCAVVVLKKGNRLVRVWVDRKTGALMQAEEFEGDKAVRRLWGTRIKKFGERWMANVMEVETLGSGHRTKITVETLK